MAAENPDLTDAEQEWLGRALSTRNTLIHVTHDGPLAMAVRGIIADRVTGAVEYERATLTAKVELLAAEWVTEADTVLRGKAAAVCRDHAGEIRALPERKAGQ